jgi:hypothetical protein
MRRLQPPGSGYIRPDWLELVSDYRWRCREMRWWKDSPQSETGGDAEAID